MASDKLMQVYNHINELKEGNESGKLAYTTMYYPVKTLGPGDRIGLWTAWCHRSCEGCISTHTHAPGENEFYIYPVDEILGIIQNKDKGQGLQGLTATGGEMFLQARAMSNILIQLRKLYPSMTMIGYTGFRFEEFYESFDLKMFMRESEHKLNYLDQLRKTDIGEVLGAHELVTQFDVLIDGIFIPRLNNGIGLRGSTNQKIVHLTQRLDNFDFENAKRTIQQVNLLNDDGGSFHKFGIPL